MITTKALAEVSKTSRQSAVDKLQRMHPIYFNREGLVFHSSTGRVMEYSLTEKAKQLIKEHLTKFA